MEREGDYSPLNVFLSHAKRDGTDIAVRLRDGIRNFGQLTVWYDSNDLPFGVPWESPMVQAVKQGTAAMIAIVTDAYSTRPWCRQEATLARTPRSVGDIPGADPSLKNVWTLQPVVAVHEPRSKWAHSLPMLAGVPRIGWDENDPGTTTAAVVDRLVLEMLLAFTHRRVAARLTAAPEKPEGSCFITWVPDTWTLIALREQLNAKTIPVRHIVYPGYGLSITELSELNPVLKTFEKEEKKVSLIPYEEAGL